MAQYADSIRTPPRTLTEREQKLLLKITGEHRGGFRDHVIIATELAEGGLSGRAKARIEELAEDAPIRHRQRRGRATPAGANPTASTSQQRDRRLPPVGEVLLKTHKGADHEVRMLEQGFEYQGERYTSLSKIAKVITGTTWNGFLFFGLTQRKAASKKAAR